MSLDQNLVEALLQILRAQRENKEIIRNYVKRIPPLRVKIFKHVLELFVIGSLTNVDSNLVFQYNPFIFVTILLGLGVSLLILALILWKY